MRYTSTSLRARRRAPRTAVTLIEMLVAIAATLVLMTAVTQVIDMLGSGMANNRATIEMMDQLRTVRQKLQTDLAGHTAQALPWQDAETGGGYLEVIEGLKKDHPDFWPNNDNRFGDVDDVIALTVRSQGPPFISTTGISDDESYVAEVVWYLKRNQDAQPDEQVLYTLYRHVELVGSNRVGGGDSTEGELGKLTMRENRWGPRSGQMPFDLNPDNLIRRREDLVLTNVLSFDVKVWDPQAPIYAVPSNDKRVMAPGDPGYSTGGTVIGRGAYVDLGYAPLLSPPSHFSSRPNRPTRNSNWMSTMAVWDTWPRVYERDGKDQDGRHGPDQGYNGLDDDGFNGVDDPGELETRPPYSHPLRGVRVTIRIYEPASQQVRQISVVQHFMPE
ncbi:MAG: hypothetical protein IIA67_05455 [Planctomycetes bacterium]|nr:hypothetical protein [Planctomycetota bacterium]